MRTLPGQEHAEIFRQVESLIARLTQEEEKFTASVTITNDRPPVMTELQHPFVTSFCRAVEAATGTGPDPRGMFAFTDGSILAPRLSLPLVVCGPGQPNIAHQPDEYVEISQLVESTRILSQALTELLSA
jgi:succinyl-diaminopimelate desuccinylase